MPGKSTVCAAKPIDIDLNMLRAHPGAAYERVTVLGYESGSQDGGALIRYTHKPKYNRDGYTYTPSFVKASKLFSQEFAAGASYYSVQMDKLISGYWHDNMNVSKKPVLLYIEWGDKTYAAEVAELNVRYERLEGDVYSKFLAKHGRALTSNTVNEIEWLDRKYAKALAELDKEQKAMLSVPGRGMNPVSIVEKFEERIGRASERHAEKVMDMIRHENIPEKTKKRLLKAYQRDCIDYFNPKDGMLSRYYKEFDVINARNKVPLRSSVNS
ncbi:MAG: hypothetical protein M1504_00010 [Candidatus Marsarchaeota archaeon]|nr:hypothetical protein [Candidatus Marsarchaeota archaeon]